MLQIITWPRHAAAVDVVLQRGDRSRPRLTVTSHVGWSRRMSMLMLVADAREINAMASQRLCWQVPGSEECVTLA